MALKKIPDEEILRIYRLGRIENIPTSTIAKQTGRSYAMVAGILSGKKYSKITGAKNQAT